MSTIINPGLDYLLSSSKLLITRNIKALATAFELPEGGYVVFNDLKEPLFWVEEDFDSINFSCALSKRPLALKIYSLDEDKELLFFMKQLRCNYCCSALCLPRIGIYTTTGGCLGFVQQKRKIYPEFDVKDAENNLVLITRGSFLNYYFVTDLYIISKDRKYTVGGIKKNWTGFLKEHLPTSEFFGVAFPQDLAVEVKALLLGAVLLTEMEGGLGEGDRFGQIGQHQQRPGTPPGNFIKYAV